MFLEWRALVASPPRGYLGHQHRFLFSSENGAWAWWPQLAAAHRPAPRPSLKLQFAAVVQVIILQGSGFKEWVRFVVRSPGPPWRGHGTRLREEELCPCLGTGAAGAGSAVGWVV